jgi:hypothetical protein
MTLPRLSLLLALVGGVLLAALLLAAAGALFAHGAGLRLVRAHD